MTKYLNCNRLTGFLFTFLASISLTGELCAQRKFEHKIIPSLDTNECYMVRWRVRNLLNTNPDNGLVFLESGRNKNYYYWVTESGALVLFADSLRSKPLAIEKRSEYSFNPWTIGKTFAILLPKKTDPEGWVRCQWKDLNSNVVLDEIWYCPMEVEPTIMWVGWWPTGQADVQIK